jgi:hypothetical protein
MMATDHILNGATNKRPLTVKFRVLLNEKEFLKTLSFANNR